MQDKYYFDSTISRGIPVIFEVLFILMAGFSLLGEISLRPVLFLIIANLLLIIFWIALSYGTYIEIIDKYLCVSRMFFRGRKTLLNDVIAIHQRPIFGGVFFEVYMKVRESDGTFREQGLINKPGLTSREYQRLVKAISAINPGIDIDPDLLRDKGMTT